MAIATSDARLAYLKVHDKMLAWLTTGWAALDGIHRLHAFGQHRPHADPLSVPCLTTGEASDQAGQAGDGERIGVRTMLAERVQTMNPVQAIATSDARLAYLKVHDKMLAWLTTGWAALDGIHWTLRYASRASLVAIAMHHSKKRQTVSDGK
jgi:hypothetical protein